MAGCSPITALPLGSASKPITWRIA
jgi:hypothetical protein